MMGHILTLNAGSSSTKFSLFEAGVEPVECVRGQVEGLGAASCLQAARPGAPRIDRGVNKSEVCDHATAVAIILAFLQDAFGPVTVEAVGHRVVRALLC
jgi:acetate kinase